MLEPVPRLKSVAIEAGKEFASETSVVVPLPEFVSSFPPMVIPTTPLSGFNKLTSLAFQPTKPAYPPGVWSLPEEFNHLSCA